MSIQLDKAQGSGWQHHDKVYGAGVLRDEKTGEALDVGHVFESKGLVLMGWEYPRHSASTGRVFVAHDTGEDAYLSQSQYFPSVVGCCICNK